MHPHDGINRDALIAGLLSEETASFGAGWEKRASYNDPIRSLKVAYDLTDPARLTP